MSDAASSLEAFLDGALEVESYGISVVDGHPQAGVEVAGWLPGGAAADADLTTSLRVWAGGDGPDDWLLRLEVQRRSGSFHLVLGLREHRALLDDVARSGSLVVVPRSGDGEALALTIDGDVLGALLQAIDGDA